MENQKYQEIIKKINEISLMSKSEILSILKSNENGLTKGAVESSKLLNGENKIEKKDAYSWWKNLITATLNPFNYLLIGIAVVSFFSDVIFNSSKNRNWDTVIVIIAMVILSVLIRFIQEFKSSKAEEALQNLITVTCAVKRDGIIEEINMKELVVGDIVHFAAGDMVPGDVRILTSKDLFVSQSSFTGESEPVEKYSSEARNNVGNIDKKDDSFIPNNIALLGSNILSGTGTGIVLAVGKKTYFGIISSAILEKKNKTSFEIGIDSVASLLVKFMFFMVPIVFVINGFTKGSWLEAFLFSITVAVGLTPEMLPMIVTTNLAKGAVSLSKKKVLVKKLDSIQNFGAMNVFCTDKTGTLTLDKIVL